MVRRWLLIGGITLGLSALLLAPGSTEARHYRGYYYGGGWYGGYWPGYYGWNAPAYGYGGYAPGYAYGPAYTSGYGGFVAGAPAGDYYAAGAPTTSYQSNYPPEGGSADQGGSRVRLNVTVPADAEVWVEGQKTTQRGANREFVSPPLNSDGRFVYTLRARWEGNDGRPVEKTREVRVRSGETARVNFLQSDRADDRRDLGGADTGRDDRDLRDLRDRDRFDDDRRDRIRDDERRGTRPRTDDLRDRPGTGSRSGTGDTGTGTRPGTSGTGTNPNPGTGTNPGTGSRTGGTSGSTQSTTPGGANPGSTGGASPGGTGSSGSSGGSSR